jgi:hypothetical protein
MDIEKLCRNSIDYLKSNYSNFPKSGFIAGGSLANVIWEKVSGNNAVINDIDVFIFEKKIDNIQGNYYVNGKDVTKLFYHKKETKNYFSDYTGLLLSIEKTKSYYFIEKTEQDKIYNFIHYSSNDRNPQVILDSFDINCTQVGYSIDEDKFYYTPEFLNFLKTGKLELTTLSSPAHSAIRLVKKKYELSATLDQLELKLCQYAIYYHLSDVIKIYFTKKYYSTYEKFKSEFEPYFRLEESPQVSNLLFESKGIQLDIWTLRTLEHLDIDILKNEERISHFLNGDSLIFFIRQVRNNKRNEFVWEQLKHLYKDSDYVDCDFEKKDVEFLSRLTNNFPDIIENLKHLKLNGQIQLIKKMFNIWKDDPIIAISVLEKHKLTPDMEISEQDLLLLELSVRKNIVIDNSTKLNKVLFFEKDSVNLNKNLDEFIF